MLPSKFFFSFDPRTIFFIPGKQQSWHFLLQSTWRLKNIGQRSPWREEGHGWIFQFSIYDPSCGKRRTSLCIVYKCSSRKHLTKERIFSRLSRLVRVHIITDPIILLPWLWVSFQLSAIFTSRSKLIYDVLNRPTDALQNMPTQHQTHGIKLQTRAPPSKLRWTLPSPSLPLRITKRNTNKKSTPISLQ